MDQTKKRFWNSRERLFVGVLYGIFGAILLKMSDVMWINYLGVILIIAAIYVITRHQSKYLISVKK